MIAFVTAPPGARAQKMRKSPSFALPVGTAVLAAGIFAADTFTHLEIAFATSYVVVILLAARFYERRGISLVAAGCLALAIISHFATPDGGAEVSGIINLLISIGVMVLTTVLVLKDQSRELALRLTQDLANRSAEIEAANKELEAFAYSVSHDLRAPLRHVVGFAELLQKHASTYLDDTSRRYVDTILTASKRMGTLIDDLLAFSRIGRAETKNGLVSLDELVREAIAELGEETKGREIAWKTGALPICVGDRAMLKLVLLNLLSNAVKFTRTRPRAEIEIGCTNPTKDKVEVFVRDNGVGFEMQYVDKLFGVFQRLHRMEEFEGTGIGLATVQRVIHRHGGKVRAEGVVDRGATIYFSLPKA
jgi:light-regulated signal transduction histidine kinase (bacteriophytochrome)